MFLFKSINFLVWFSLSDVKKKFLLKETSICFWIIHMYVYMYVGLCTCPGALPMKAGTEITGSCELLHGHPLADSKLAHCRAIFSAQKNLVSLSRKHDYYMIYLDLWKPNVYMVYWNVLPRLMFLTLVQLAVSLWEAVNRVKVGDLVGRDQAPQMSLPRVWPAPEFLLLFP